MAAKDWGIGLVGLGGIARQHLEGYRRQGLRLAAATDVDAATVAGLPQRWSAQWKQPWPWPEAQLTTTLDELLAREDVRVVDVTVPHRLEWRRPVVEAIARAGKPILIQKPLASYLHEARELAAIARDAGVPMMVNQNSLFVPAFTAIEPYLRDPNYLGTPYYCEINNRHWSPPRANHWYETSERWVTAGMAIHHLALVRHWFGDAGTVYCLQARDPSQRTAGDTLGAVSIRFKSGVQALIINNWCHRGSRAGDRSRPHPLEELVIQGDRGSISGDTAQLCVVSDALGEAKLFPKIDGAWFPDAFGHSMRHFIDALDNARPFLCEATDNVKTVAIMEAAYRSAASGDVVRVDQLT